MCHFFSLILAGLTSPLQYSAVTPSCQGLQSKHEFSNFSVGRRYASGNLSICVYNDTTCCSKDMEQLLHTLSESNVRNIHSAKTDLIRRIFSNGVTKFKDFFEGYIDTSDKSLDNEFTKLYKTVYANNSHVTKSFYNKLRKYFRNGEYKINEIVDEFFKEVLKRMYLLLRGGMGSRVNSTCVASTYNKIHPFGNVPRQIIPRLERSITAARVMIHSLHVGKTAVDKLSEAGWFSSECLKSVTKMSQCSICAGYSGLKPCAGHCIDVFTECFSKLTAVERVWDEYLSTLIRLGYKLTGEYDFEAVTGELPYDISDGIRNCQDALPKILPQIDELCQIKKAKKQTRSVKTSDDDFFLERNDRAERSVDTWGSRKPRYKIYSAMNSHQRQFNKLKKFWTKLPIAMCDETVVATNSSAHCWDGSNIVNNTGSVQQSNKNQTYENGQNDQTIALMISELKSVIESMKEAIQGTSVYTDIPDVGILYSGSGASGSGSGNDVDGDEDKDGPTSNNIPSAFVTESIDDNSVNDPEVIVIKNPDLNPKKIGGGGAGYAHTCLLLLIPLLLIQFM